MWQSNLASQEMGTDKSVTLIEVRIEVRISSLHNLNTANAPQFLLILECQKHYYANAIQGLIISLSTQNLTSNFCSMYQQYNVYEGLKEQFM